MYICSTIRFIFSTYVQVALVQVVQGVEVAVRPAAEGPDDARHVLVPVGGTLAEPAPVMVRTACLSDRAQ